MHYSEYVTWRVDFKGSLFVPMTCSVRNVSPNDNGENAVAVWHFDDSVCAVSCIVKFYLTIIETSGNNSRAWLDKLTPPHPHPPLLNAVHGF